MRSDAPSLTWRPALDGLRGIAVIGVMLYHYQTRTWFPGGLFGVDLFFVLSGFLITTLLVQEWQRAGAISLLGFFRRRFIRLAPALLVFLIAYTAVVFALSGDDTVENLTGWQALQNALRSLTLSYNWGQVTGAVASGGYVHLWSLAVEAQFYLLWPLALIAMLRAQVRPLFLLIACGTLCILFASVPLALSDPAWNRLYFATDYRAHQLLIGACLGIMLASGMLRRSLVTSPVFPVALAGSLLFLAFVVTSTSGPFFYANYGWLFPAVAISSAVLVVAATFSDDVPELRMLESPLLTWLGRRSYAVYIWHYPMGLAFASLTPLGQLVIAGCMTLAIAEVSYRLIEAPVLRWGRKRTAHSTSPGDVSHPLPASKAA